MMKRIALISDTHGPLLKDVLPYLADCDEIWHAGDIGGIKVLDQMASINSVRAVYGNIDDHVVRSQCPKDLFFNCEGLKVLITHIGGYPSRYNQRVKALISELKPDLYIAGHSHICKIMKDEKNKLIHINPGACGQVGFHRVRTLVLFEIDKAKLQNVRVVELGTRAHASTPS